MKNCICEEGKWVLDFMIYLFFLKVEPEESNERGQGCSAMDQDEPPEKQSKIKQEVLQSPPKQPPIATQQQHFQKAPAQDNHHSQQQQQSQHQQAPQPQPQQSQGSQQLPPPEC